MSSDHQGCSSVILDALGSFWVIFENHEIWHQDDVSTLQTTAPDAILLCWRTMLSRSHVYAIKKWCEALSFRQSTLREPKWYIGNFTQNDTPTDAFSRHQLHDSILYHKFGLFEELEQILRQVFILILVRGAEMFIETRLYPVPPESKHQDKQMILKSTQDYSSDVQ